MRVEVTVTLAKLNLALHGLSGDIRLGNSYYGDLHHSAGAFDFVMANTGTAVIEDGEAAAGNAICQRRDTWKMVMVIGPPNQGDQWFLQGATRATARAPEPCRCRYRWSEACCRILISSSRTHTRSPRW